MISNKINKNLNFNIKKNFIYLGQTINDALKILSFSKFKICLVLNKNNFFKGVIVDGDIRRALLNGKDLESKINNVFNSRPMIIKENFIEADVLNKLAAKNIDHAPLIKKNKVIGLFSQKTSLAENIKIPVVIMCGGLGKRLRPITQKIPKALVKINKIPMLSHVIGKIKNYGFNKFILSTHYKSFLIKKFYKDGKNLNVQIHYSREKKPLGTAGPMSLLKKQIKQKNFIMTNCDVISEINYKNFLDFHIKNNADLTVGVKRVELENSYGKITLNRSRIVSIIEKPKKTVIINAAIYAIKTKYLKKLKYNEKIDMNEFILKLINEKKKVIAFPFFESWYDLGTKDQLKFYKNYR